MSDARLAAVKIVEVIHNVDRKAYLVGGCVRDELMGREPNDYDVASEFGPAVTTQIFTDLGHKVIQTGAAHGTVTVMVGKVPIEVTSFRSDGEYMDGRRPKKVHFEKTIEKDLARRDFTVNAIAYDPVNNVYVDPFNGRDDIRRGVIRCVGDTKARFMEDGLRPFRAFRFQAQLGFIVTGQIFEACRDPDVRLNMAKVSKERVRDEFLKGLTAARPEFLMKLGETGLINFILPEIFDVHLHLKDVKMVESYREVLAQLLVHLPPAMVEASLRRLKLKADDIQFVTSLVKALQMPKMGLLAADVNAPWIYRGAFRKRRYELGDSVFESWMRLSKFGTWGGSYVIYKNREFFAETLPQLAINGNDLMALGVPAGPHIGETLNTLRDWMFASPESRNNKHALLEKLREEN